LLGPSGDAHTGRQAIDAYWMRPDWMPVDWRLEVRSVAPAGEFLVAQTRRSTLTADHGGGPRVSVVDFVLVWKRQAAGGLKIVLDLYESASG